MLILGHFPRVNLIVCTSAGNSSPSEGQSIPSIFLLLHPLQSSVSYPISGLRNFPENYLQISSDAMSIFTAVVCIAITIIESAFWGFASTCDVGINFFIKSALLLWSIAIGAA